MCSIRNILEISFKHHRNVIRNMSYLVVSIYHAEPRTSPCGGAGGGCGGGRRVCAQCGGRSGSAARYDLLEGWKVLSWAECSNDLWGLTLKTMAG